MGLYFAVKLTGVAPGANCSGVDAVQMTLPKPDYVIDTGVEVIDPKSVGEYIEGLKKLGIESS